MASTSVLLAEIVGTFVFVLAILSVALREKDTIPSHFVPFLIAAGLMVAIYIGAGLGGNAHLNPAVSVIMGVNGSIDMVDVVPHVLAQLVGAGGAYLVFKSLHQQ